MARAGLGPAWTCVWANDFSPEKALTYRRNWIGNELHEGDVAAVKVDSLPNADLAWASFPCQDLSLAGEQSGLGNQRAKASTRSGTFWPFWRLMKLKRPPVIVLENVAGALTSNKGADIRALCSAMSGAEYMFGPMVLDAVHWLPQSRPRLYIVAVRRDVPIPRELLVKEPSPVWHPRAVVRAHSLVGPDARRNWVWWNLPVPTEAVPHLDDLIGDGDAWSRWNGKKETDYLLSLMAPRHRDKVNVAKNLQLRVIGTAYRRTRGGQQRAEVRFDGVAGCLRTAAGGSSRQIVFEVVGQRVRSRLMSPREAARLQGLPDTYELPEAFNEAYNLVGDGLTVPVVAHLREHLLNALVQPAAQLAIA